jgi:hypothetical protein
MTDICPANPAAGVRRSSIFAGLWAWLCTSFFTSVPEAGNAPSHLRGPWDRPGCSVYVTGCEVSCVQERPYVPPANKRDSSRYAVHRYGQ